MEKLDRSRNFRSPYPWDTWNTQIGITRVNVQDSWGIAQVHRQSNRFIEGVVTWQDPFWITKCIRIQHHPVLMLVKNVIACSFSAAVDQLLLTKPTIKFQKKENCIASSFCHSIYILFSNYKHLAMSCHDTWTTFSFFVYEFQELMHFKKYISISLCSHSRRGM